KNQQKKVVVQVTADGLSSDPWAWRKYGQKPIKGSIYPRSIRVSRSYYRCSSSKACMARRQVEQSCKDSSIYILTYTADHNHPQPTRRNSLAGINRNRFKATPKSPTLSDEVSKAVTKLKDSPFNSPTTPASASSMDDEVLQQPNIKQETTFYNKYDDQGHTMMSGFNDDELMLFSDDFFEGLEDLVGYKMETSSSSQISSNKQFPRVFS
ncbi:WRKY 5 transcription factor, partial [Tanacetum coccineum]